MVGIKDFGMPSCCENCDLYEDDCYCGVTGSRKADDEKAKLEDCPLIDVQPVVHAEWSHQNDDYFDWWECSNCGYGSEGEMQFVEGTDIRTNYCPCCGAKMS